MLVNDEIINELYNDAGSERVQKSRLYVRTEECQLKKSITMMKIILI